MVKKYLLDVEDEKVQNYVINNERCKITVKGYKIQKNSKVRYVVGFGYNSIEYKLIGIMKQQEIEKIIKNLFF